MRGGERSDVTRCGGTGDSAAAAADEAGDEVGGNAAGGATAAVAFDIFGLGLFMRFGFNLVDCTGAIGGSSLGISNSPSRLGRMSSGSTGFCCARAARCEAAQRKGLSVKCTWPKCEATYKSNVAEMPARVC